MHNVLPFMVLGIGVDNMFVIVSCVDQSPTDLPIDERIRIGLVHAGPSITITSLTDAIAFFLASWTALAPPRGLVLKAAELIIRFPGHPLEAVHIVIVARCYVVVV